YAIQLASPKAAADLTSYSGEYYKLEDFKVITQEKFGFYAEVSNFTNYILPSVCEKRGPNDEITAFSTGCMVQGLIIWPETWCLAILNHLNFSQNVD
ncbi:6168_t:CDS:1, partial [Funneliformis geosporum]